MKGSAAQQAPLVVVMGVSGSGKSSVGLLVAESLGVSFVDGDELHSAANVAKMSSGIPLTDEDRWPWLHIVGQTISAARHLGVVMACSSLKRSYRDVIAGHAPATIFVHLDGPRELLLQRLRARQGHFMPVQLLDSQIADLEPLQPDERHIVIDIAPPLDRVAGHVIESIRSVSPGVAARPV